LTLSRKEKLVVAVKYHPMRERARAAHAIELMNEKTYYEGARSSFLVPKRRMRKLGKGMKKVKYH